MSYWVASTALTFCNRIVWGCLPCAKTRDGLPAVVVAAGVAVLLFWGMCCWSLSLVIQGFGCVVLRMSFRSGVLNEFGNSTADLGEVLRDRIPCLGKGLCSTRFREWRARGLLLSPFQGCVRVQGLRDPKPQTLNPKNVLGATPEPDSSPQAFSADDESSSAQLSCLHRCRGLGFRSLGFMSIGFRHLGFRVRSPCAA